jgi:hypothetical protein
MSSLPSRLSDRTSTTGANQRHDDAGPNRAAPATRRPPSGTLDLSIRRRGAVIELCLSGDLDMSTAPRLGGAIAFARNMATTPRKGEAAAWLRSTRGPAATIVIDTSEVGFIGVAGRALQAALAGRDGLEDPRVVWSVGPAVARFEAAVTPARGPP